MAEAEYSRHNWKLNVSEYLGDISSLSFLHLPTHVSSIPYLLAGSGSQISLYDLGSGDLICSFQVFEGVRVHGTTCNSSYVQTENEYTYKLVIFGEKRVKIFTLTVELDSNSGETSVKLNLVNSLPKLGNWVLDVCFLQGSFSSSEEEQELLAIGCSDNSISVWDVKQSRMVLEIRSPDRCLLYSMRLWGDSIQTLRIASGTIYNEIIVWRAHLLEDDRIDHDDYNIEHMLRLKGHEGSIFSIVWSMDGSKLVSVSDDRSARIWEVDSMQNHSNDSRKGVGPVLFGHGARVWDCCISDSLIVTVGEDCTCRVWDWDGKQLDVIKEHIGRGIWRCLYDPSSSLLVTAGFDSAIKVHRLHRSGCGTFLDTSGERKSCNEMESLSVSLPNSTQNSGLMDSKSEYVRCLRFTQEDTMYVATNNGFLYHVTFSTSDNVKWTKLIRILEEGPIICMDVMHGREPQDSSGLDDWISLGDGKGNMTIVRVIGDTHSPVIGFRNTWKAGPERQLLGTFWCNSLGHRYVFSANPRGQLKLWRITSLLASHPSAEVSLVAEFTSSFGMRIMCLNALVEEEVLVCGDVRGNISLFLLSKSMLCNETVSSEMKITPTKYFKGAHGISTVSSVSVSKLITSNKVEICSTGGDGCICYFEYDRKRVTLDFTGLKQVKELSLVLSVSQGLPFKDQYAAGFASTDFILWNLSTETKVAQISCGGWRRPHSFYLGDIPEMNNCFAYVKDDIIRIHKQMNRELETKVSSQNLHLRFHGREIHSLCFVSEDSRTQRLYNQSSLIATGCEDGTVRLTRFGNRSTSELLGEHVGGSAVRCVCFVSKTHIVASDASNLVAESGEDDESPSLLISVGAKRVLTSWLLRNSKGNNITDEASSICRDSSSSPSSSITFQWLATDMPTRSSPREDLRDKIVNSASDSVRDRETHEDDWRYMAVTAFLVKSAGSRSTICFIAVACSDATLRLRALVLPHRLWFDVTSLVPLTSPVLSLQHAVVPISMNGIDERCFDGAARNVYLVISGATDGSIAFWDVTQSVEAFVKQVSNLEVEKLIDCQKRPRTGRGSQGGRKWKSLSPNNHKQEQDSNSVGGTWCSDELGHAYIVKNAHQSGVNCLHVSRSDSSDDGFVFNVISGGDDQSLRYLTFDVVHDQRLTVRDHGAMSSAHNSAVKGVWMDGNWVFSTGLDQRVRCWYVNNGGQLEEHSHIIISVPEPETLDAISFGENRYHIVVAGRGMQTVEFSA